ncbi:hypothetical protein FRZ61_43050 [Hypericibacter adhaerens]|uniref:Cyclic nucleotide-binding domain-containing protein n=1 Tax=Hypericibacter adhaerens TaxID=2602016 RepID=A0A5J6N4K6_9PROT|nr:cyclic nucleotide-binding domain-containing protein [Hypericibacter adhaerens]QEX24364.1 hypothetical protein FRZ61_43050 [Hypericibacter adhaerens]
MGEIVTVALLGLAATASNLVGAACGLYLRISKLVLSGILAFAAGALISALAIELAFGSATAMRNEGFSADQAWYLIGGGFAVGAVIYYIASLALERRGAAVRFPSRFREYAQSRRRQDAGETIRLLAKCDLLRYLPPEHIELLLLCVQRRRLKAGEVLFRAGDQADALYIVASGKVVVSEDGDAGAPDGRALAELGEGQAFGEMALLTGGKRTATVRARTDTELLAIRNEDFAEFLAQDAALAEAMRRLGHARALANLSAGGAHPATWAAVASSSLNQPSRREAERLLAEASHGAGLAIVLGNILDTIPGCLVIGAKYSAMHSISPTLLLGMIIGGLPEAAASANMLNRAGYRDRTILALWSTVIVTGVIAALAGNLLLGSSQSLIQSFFQAVAGGAVLALVAHAMIPEAIEEAGSLIVLPTVAGFLFALYLALTESLG